MALGAPLEVALLAAALLAAPGGRGGEEQGAGVLAGRVRLVGGVPEAVAVAVAKDRGTCGAAQEVLAFMADQDGGLAEAAVLLPDLVGAPPAAAPTLDNVGCRFALALQVVPPGALLSIRNSDRILHSAHAIDERGATRFHVALPVFREETPASVGPPGFLRIRCDVGHPWMRAGIVVTAGPAAITDRAGQFRIPGVPAGVHRLLLWHDGLGLRELAVTVAPGEETWVEWAVEAPAARARVP
ncbi:MAG TPA: hypothetical protein VFV36_08580 [Candidatus Methylomirabilis sp.]|nr:hypothetical protein [Candidatus Methylomirabilis sp.]